MATHLRPQSGGECAQGFDRLFGADDVTRTLSARYYKDGSEILVAQKRKRPRRLVRPFAHPLRPPQILNRFRRAERHARLRAYAKLNLDLKVLNRGVDGFHELRSVFQTVSIFDTLDIAFTPGRKTELTLVHGPFADPVGFNGHNAGWMGSFDKLDAFLGG